MTVDAVNTDIFDDSKVTGVLCAWFVSNKLERARFDRDAIGPAPTQATSSERREMPPPDVAGEYKAILDEMAAAMNDAVQAPGDASKASVERPKRPLTRKQAAGAALLVRDAD